MTTTPAKQKRGKSGKPWIVLFFIFLFFLMFGLSRIVYSPLSGKLEKFEPGAGGRGSDDAHYLLAVNSLLFDKDLQLQEDYRRVGEGGMDAGFLSRGKLLDHHSLLVDPSTKEHRYFSSVFEGERHIRCVAEVCRAYLNQWQIFSNPDAVVEFPAHPLGFPLAVAGILSLTFPRLDQTEARMNLVMIFFSWLGAVLVYRAARGAGLCAKYSMMAAAILAFASPWLAYSRSYFSEPLAGVWVLAGLLALQSNRPTLAGLAGFAALTIKLPYALVGLGWILDRLLVRRFRDAALLALVLGLGTGLLGLFNYWQAGTFLIGGHIDPATIWGPFRPWRTFLDLRYGLFPFVPWATVACIGVIAAFFKKETNPGVSTLRMMFFPLLFYALLLAFHRPLGASSYACRYWIPFLPWFALAAGVIVSKGGQTLRLITYNLVILGAAVALPAALTYPYAWDQPPTAPLIWLLGL